MTSDPYANLDLKESVVRARENRDWIQHAFFSEELFLQMHDNFTRAGEDDCLDAVWLAVETWNGAHKYHVAYHNAVRY